MEQRDQKEIIPTSKETVGDEILERNLNRLVSGPQPKEVSNLNLDLK
jgi:hypothetical protein